MEITTRNTILKNQQSLTMVTRVLLQYLNNKLGKYIGAFFYCNSYTICELVEKITMLRNKGYVKLLIRIQLPVIQILHKQVAK